MDKRKVYIPLALAIFIAYGIYNTIKKDNNLSDNKKIGIAKVYEISYSHYRHNADFSFEYNGKWYKGYEYIRDERRESLIDKYFIVEFSSKNPDNNKLLLDRPVYDTLRIKNAGFKINK